MKVLVISLTALALFALPAMAEERGGGAVGASSVSEKSSSSSEKPKVVGDLRDCLYAKFGSKGINHHVVKSENPGKWWRVVKKCEGCKKEAKIY